MIRTEPVTLDAPCDRCGHKLQLVEGTAEHLIGCPVCDDDSGRGATPADALTDWTLKHEPVFSLTPLASFVVPPSPPWVFTVGGYPFTSLSDAEAYSAENGGEIYCRLRTSQKAANE